jgi:TfoX/Sxy family transcriptional regulator of competence genes
VPAGHNRGMSYDEDLADRIRQVVGPQSGLTERRMFGGHAFLVNGNLAVSASGKGGLLLRVDPAETDALVENPGVSRFEMRGREMDGWLHVQPEAVQTREQLDAWVRRGTTYARSLPPKAK